MITYKKIDLLPEGSVPEEYYTKAKPTIDKIKSDIDDICFTLDIDSEFLQDIKLTTVEDEHDGWFELGYHKEYPNKSIVAFWIVFEDEKSPIISFSCSDEDGLAQHSEMCSVDSWYYEDFLVNSINMIVDVVSFVCND